MKFILIWFIYLSVLVKPAMPMLEYFVECKTQAKYSGKSWLVQQLLKQTKAEKEKKEGATSSRSATTENSSSGILQHFLFSIIRTHTSVLKPICLDDDIQVSDLITSVFQPPEIN